MGLVFLPGDIVLSSGRGWTSRIISLALGSPWTHAFLVMRREDELGDYSIIESIGKGMTVGLLSFYRGQRIAVLRLRAFDDAGGASPAARLAVANAVRLGRSSYDYRLLPWIALTLLLGRLRAALPRRWDRALDCVRVPYLRDSRFICSELVVEAYARAGVQLLPRSSVPLPPAIAASDRLRMVYQGQLPWP